MLKLFFLFLYTLIMLEESSARNWYSVGFENAVGIDSVHSLQKTCKYLDSTTLFEAEPNQALYPLYPHEYAEMCKGFLDGFLASVVMGYDDYPTSSRYYDMPNHHDFIKAINTLKDNHSVTDSSRALASKLMKILNENFLLPAEAIETRSLSPYSFFRQTSQELHRYFKKALQEEDGVHQGSFYAVVYSNAYLQGIRTFQSLIKKTDQLFDFEQTRYLKNKRGSIPDSKITNEQIMRTYVKWAEDEPHLLDLFSVISLKEVLTTYFPGSKSKHNSPTDNLWGKFVSEVK